MKNKLYRQIIIIVCVTVAIIVAGFLLPRLLLANKLIGKEKIDESVEADAISPYGADVIKKQTDISVALNSYKDNIYPNDYKVLASYDCADGTIASKMAFMNDFLNLMNEHYGNTAINIADVCKKFSVLGTADYEETGISHVYDGSINPVCDYYVESNSGILLNSSMHYSSRKYVSTDFWRDLIQLYSAYVGMDFIEYYWNTLYMGFGGIAVSTDGNFYLKIECYIDDELNSQYYYNMDITLWSSAKVSLSDLETSFVINSYVD